MSDGAVMALVAGLVQITFTVVGFLTLWVKLKYGVDQAKDAANLAAAKADVVEEKIDNNTSITSLAATAASKASEHAEICDEERQRLLKGLSDHDTRISSLELQVTSLKVSVESVAKSVDSTRHEMRGHLQSVVNKLDIIGMSMPRPAVPVNLVEPTKDPR